MKRDYIKYFVGLAACSFLGLTSCDDDKDLGGKIARYYGATNMKVLNFGAKKEFVDRYDIQEFLRANHLTDEQIVEDITAVIG